MGSEESNVSAAQLVVAVPAPDDAGASTADRYDWQAAMAAADGLSLYRALLDHGDDSQDQNDYRIICEYHEDWIVIQGDGAELVSAKHRDPSSGAYTTAKQLASDGGLAHLFVRWNALEEKPTCRLVTTAGLAPGQPQGLERAAVAFRQQIQVNRPIIIADHDLPISALCGALQVHRQNLPEPWRSESPESLNLQKQHAARFLAALRIQHGEVRRSHIGYAAPSMYAKPVLEKLELDAPCDAIWEAVLNLFRVRMRAAGTLPTGALPVLMTYRADGSSSQTDALERFLAVRTVTMSDIEVAIRMAASMPAGYCPLPPVKRASRMALKMARGGCFDNSIERAEQLRLDHQTYWSNRSGGDPAARAERERLRRTLLRISDNATVAAQSQRAVWGQDLWQELQKKVASLDSQEIPQGMDTELLLGGIGDLANRCQIWFSDAFDIDALIADQRRKRGVQR